MVVDLADFGDVRRARVRKYPWGTVEIENSSYSDFVLLRDSLMRSARF
jgi:septin family protein